MIKLECFYMLASFIVPLLNEEENLIFFYKELQAQIFKLKIDFEMIFVDDGSTDGSLDILKKLAKQEKNVKIFSFRKNLGKSEALTLGFQKAKGDYIITLDADLQDQPSEISKLLKKTKEGYDLVCGWRRNRQDPFLKVISSKFFNFLTGVFWGLKLHDYNCGLKVYSKEATKSLRLYGGMHRFIPLLVYQQGFRVTEVAILHQGRKFGKSKYSLSKLWKDLPDLFTMLFLSKYGNRPLHFFSLIGGILFLSGFIISIYLTYIRFQGEAIGRRPLLFLGVLLIISGLQVFLTGFLADLFINSSHQNSNGADIPLKYSSE